jgi:protein ImuA
MNKTEVSMGQAEPMPILHHLRQSLAALDPSLAPKLADEDRCISLAPPIDTTLGGGLACGALHELVPAVPIHLGATSGFAVALAVRAAGRRGEVLWITTDLATREGGSPYGPGLDLFGLPSARLLLLRVPRPIDVLWAMEEALRCRGLACAVAELTGEGGEADLTATRRLALAARDGALGFGLLIRHRVTAVPSAAATRWQIAAAPSEPDAYGGLGRMRFDLTLTKNRRGPSGRWLIEWNHHECVFEQTIPVGVAPPALDRPDRAPLVRTG